MTATDPTEQSVDERAADQRPPGWPGRLRALVAASCVAPVCGYLGVALVIALVVASAEGAGVSAPLVLLAALPGWLAAFQVPLSIQQAPLTALPLLPTILMMSLIARTASRAAVRSDVRSLDHTLWLIFVFGLSHAVWGAGIALVVSGEWGAPDLVPGAEVVVADAFAYCGLVATVSASLGLLRRIGAWRLLAEYLPASLWVALRAAVVGIAAVMATGAVLILGATVLSLPELAARSGQLGSLGDTFGATLLCLAYFPDAVLAAWSYATGVGMSIGAWEFAPLTGAGSEELASAVPALGSLLGLLPVLPGPSAAFVLVLPVSVGVLVGWMCKRAHGNVYLRLRAAVIAASVVTGAVAIVAVVAGGEFGGGRLGSITLHPAMLVLLTWCWVVVPAIVVAWMAGDRKNDEYLVAEPAQLPDAGSVAEVDDDWESDEAAAAEWWPDDDWETDDTDSGERHGVEAEPDDAEPDDAEPDAWPE